MTPYKGAFPTESVFELWEKVRSIILSQNNQIIF